MTGRVRLGLIVGGAAAVLLAALTMMRDSGPGATAAAAGSQASAPAVASGGAPVVNLGLERLNRTPLEPEDVERNLFRFRSVAAQDPEFEAPAPRSAPAPRVPAASSSPPLMPIPLRYIGLLEAPTQGGRVGIFSDGRGNVFYAREGDIIEGRYPAIQIGPISAELSHLDGSGRQTIRLSGQ